MNGDVLTLVTKYMAPLGMTSTDGLNASVLLGVNKDTRIAARRWPDATEKEQLAAVVASLRWVARWAACLKADDEARWESFDGGRGRKLTPARMTEDGERFGLGPLVLPHYPFVDVRTEILQQAWEQFAGAGDMAQWHQVVAEWRQRDQNPQYSYLAHQAPDGDSVLDALVDCQAEEHRTFMTMFPLVKNTFDTQGAIAIAWAAIVFGASVAPGDEGTSGLGLIHVYVEQYLFRSKKGESNKEILYPPRPMPRGSFGFWM